jgi:HSP20 family protein
MSIKDLIPWKREADAPVRHSPSPFLSLQREFNRLFDEFWDEWGIVNPDMPGTFTTRFQPRVDVEETPDAYRVTAEVPGMDEKDIEVELHQNTLVLKGEKKEEHEKKEGGYVRHERRSGSFQRIITLPAEVQYEHAKAAYRQGVLTITLPKTAEVVSQRKRIQITTE